MHISIVTACGRRERTKIEEEAANSVKELALILPHRTFHWIRVLDGDGLIPPVASPPPNLIVDTLPPLRNADGELVRLGPGAPRNRALDLAAPGWMLNLDADDRFIATAMARHILLAENAKVDWAAALCNTMDGEGTIIGGHPATLQPGLQEAGSMLSYFQLHNEAPWHCGSMVINRDLLRKAGGWAPWLRGVDTAMALLLTRLEPGLFTEEIVFDYRRHAPQVTRNNPLPWGESGREFEFFRDYVERSMAAVASQLF